MKTKLTLIVLIIMLVSTMVSAVTWSPQGDMNLKGRYSIFNVTNFTADNLSGNLSWTDLHTFPSACPSGSAVTELGDTTTCTAFGSSLWTNESSVATYDGNVGNKLCRSGWLLVDNDVEMIQVTPARQSIPSGISNSKQSECNNKGCWVKN